MIKLVSPTDETASPEQQHIKKVTISIFYIGLRSFYSTLGA